MSTLYAVGKALLRPLATSWRLRVTGLENLPASGPTILASNHLSVVDSIVLPLALPRQIYFLAKDDYFVGTGVKGAISRQVMYGLNQIPVDRSGGRASLMALDAALPVLREGRALGIYPEGTRSPDGRLYRGRPGVAKLALDAGATIVPVGLAGTEAIQPIGVSRPRLTGDATVTVGRPLDLAPWRDRPVDSRVLREITEALMREIQKLTGQEYVGRYARRDRSVPDAATAGSTEAQPAGG
jgi:1-acyl-sn-glycerol-3-phosphate acyltransferase